MFFYVLPPTFSFKKFKNTFLQKMKKKCRTNWDVCIGGDNLDNTGGQGRLFGQWGKRIPDSRGKKVGTSPRGAPRPFSIAEGSYYHR